MSRWLGMRQALPSSPNTADDNGKKKLATKRGNISPTAHRGEPRINTPRASRPSPQASQASPNACSAGDTNGHGADSTGAYGDESEEHNGCEDDWMVLGDASLRAREGERPLSPGVDIMGANGRGGSEEAVAGEEGCRDKWLDAGNIHSFLVRGATYLTDKGKRPAGAAMCRLVGFDCFSEGSKGTTRIDHIGSRGRCRERVEELTAGEDAPFLFIMNIQVRGTPTVSLVAYWAVDRHDFAVACQSLGRNDQSDEATNTAADGGASNEANFARIVASYANIPVSTFGGEECEMMDATPPPPYTDERNRRFKLIPRVVDGPWMVRKAVGTTPVLLGTKINHRYYRGERYVETDMDTGSSPAAASLCGRCRGLSRKLHVELGVVLQANSAEELPEALLGAVRLNGFGVEDPDLQIKLLP